MTYSPVASWNSVRMLLTLTALHGWTTKQIDFVQAFAQAPIEKTLYMKVPAGVELEDGSDPRDYALKLHRNIYGQKQAGRVWNQYLVQKLIGKLGFKQSSVDDAFSIAARLSMFCIPTTVYWPDLTPKKSTTSLMSCSQRQSWTSLLKGTSRISLEYTSIDERMGLSICHSPT